MTDTDLVPVDDPAVRAALATMYVQRSRDNRSSYRDRSATDRLLTIAANWQRIRDHLAYLVALSVVEPDGSIRGQCSFGRDFVAAHARYERAIARWRVAYRAGKDADA